MPALDIKIVFILYSKGTLNFVISKSQEFP